MTLINPTRYGTGRAVALGAAALLALSACSTDSGGQSDADGGSGQPSMTVTFISGPLTDPFFGAMKAGAEDAAADLGVDFTYSAPANFDNLEPDLQRLEEAARADAPDVLLASPFFPSQDEELTGIASDGVPVILVNAGGDRQEDIGALNYIGEDATVVGQRAADRMLDNGVTNAVCVIHVPGNPTLEARCDGFISTFEAAGQTATLQTIPTQDSNNPTAVQQAIGGTLQADPSINGVFTLGSAIAQAGQAAIESADLGDRVQLATTDLSNNVLQAVQDGSISFIIDQQPYLQGYYGVLMAAQYHRLGIYPVLPVTTAPLFITEDNVQAVIDSNANGDRGAA